MYADQATRHGGRWLSVLQLADAVLEALQECRQALLDLGLNAGLISAPCAALPKTLQRGLLDLTTQLSREARCGDLNATIQSVDTEQFCSAREHSDTFDKLSAFPLIANQSLSVFFPLNPSNARRIDGCLRCCKADRE